MCCVCVYVVFVMLCFVDVMDGECLMCCVVGDGGESVDVDVGGGNMRRFFDF